MARQPPPMFIHFRNWSLILAPFALVAASAVCTGPEPPVAPPANRSDDPPASPASVPVDPVEHTQASSVVDTSGPGGPAYTFRFKLTPSKDLFYIIENQYRDSGGVPPLLAYSTWAKDKKTIRQQVLPASVRQPTSANAAPPSGAYVTWRCDRYEVQEQGHKEKVTYDSIRDLYPPPSLMDLGGIAGAKATIIIDEATGEASDIALFLTTQSNPNGRRNLSRTTEKCLWNTEALTALLHDLGPYYFPKGPVRVGDSWGHTVSETMKTFGTVTTDVRCTLRSVKPIEGRDIATIEISGEVTLTPNTKPATTSHPTTASAPAENKPKDFRIDRAACNGSVEFDLTRGEIVQLMLRRDLAFVADVSSPNSGPMQLKSGTEHILRVKSSQTAPPRPLIVGGPKPPVVPPEEKDRPGRARARPTPNRNLGPTSRPAIQRPPPTSKPTVKQAPPPPNSKRPPVRPASPTSAPR